MWRTKRLKSGLCFHPNNHLFDAQTSIDDDTHCQLESYCGGYVEKRKMNEKKTLVQTEEEKEEEICTIKIENMNRELSPYQKEMLIKETKEKNEM